jgi:tetratricopeptide (TPR) repeat protein
MFRRIKIYRKIKAGKFAEALALLPSEENVDGLDLLLRSHCFIKLFQYDKAQQDLDKLKENKKYAYDAYNNQGYIYLEQGHWDKAITELTKARELNPKHSFALDNLGHAYMMTNRIEEGVEMVEKAFKLDKYNYYAVRNIGIYYMLKKQYTDALVVLKKAKAKDKTIDDIDVYIAICELRNGDNDRFTEITQTFSDRQKNRLESLSQNFA